MLENIGFYTLSDYRACNVTDKSQMQRCEIIINEYCNFKCPYCKGLDSSVFSDRKRKELTYEEICNTIDIWCKDIPLKNIRFSGGEPTYHKDIVKVIQYAKDKGIERIAVSTNGSNTKELYDQMIEAGMNDASISLDADNETVGDMMAGNIKGAWKKVVENIQYISSRIYVTVGVVLNQDNIDEFIRIVKFASILGVDDIRVISSAQWNEPLSKLDKIPVYLLDKHPILKYRVENFKKNLPIRGLDTNDHKHCPLVLDDSVVAGKFHYPCVIYMREQGKPVGMVNKNMRAERVNWFKNNNVLNDSICSSNCLDVCVDYNKTVMENNQFVKTLLEK